MGSKIIGLLAAMPDEIRPLLKRVGRVERGRAERFREYRFTIRNIEVRLVESGMGMERATAAAEVLSAVSPAAVISFGFGGAVLPGLAVGDLVVGSGSLLYDGGKFRQCEGINLALADDLLHRLTGGPFQAAAGTIITSRHILNKGALAPALPPALERPVLDMETAAIASVMSSRGIPLVALRAVSDDAAEELAFSLDEFADHNLTIRPAKVLFTILRKPWIVPQLVRLARNSRLAGETLASAVTAAVPAIASRLA